MGLAAGASRPWRKRAAVAALAALLALLAGELLCRHLELPLARGPLAWKAKWGPQNSLGFRGPEPASPARHPRLLLLGDSQVEAVSLHDFRRAPGPRLQRHLHERGHPWEVVSLGASGWGTDQQLIALQHYFSRLAPDAVVLFATAENDAIENLFCTGPGGPKPTYRLSGDGRLVPPASGWAPAGSKPSFGLVPLVRRALAPALPTDRQWDDTMPAPTPAPPVTGAASPLAGFLRGLYGFAPGLKLADLEACHVSWSLFRQPTPGRVAYALALQQVLLAAMKDTCARQGVPLFVFKQRDPSLQQKFEGRILTLEGRALRFSPAAVETLYRQMMERLQIPYLDLRLDYRVHSLLPRDPHLNAAGYAVVARRVGRWLLGQPRFLAQETR